MLKEQSGTHTAAIDELAHARRVWRSVALYLFAAVIPGSVCAAFAVELSPASGATQVCIDTPLSITFNQQPQLGTSGAIRVFNWTVPWSMPSTSRIPARVSAQSGEPCPTTGRPIYSITFP